MQIAPIRIRNPHSIKIKQKKERNFNTFVFEASQVLRVDATLPTLFS